MVDLIEDKNLTSVTDKRSQLLNLFLTLILHSAREREIKEHEDMKQVYISTALHTWSTSNVWISFITFLTRTNREMVTHKAVSINTTITRVATEPVDASFIVGTFAVRGAAGRTWYNNC